MVKRIYNHLNKRLLRIRINLKWFRDRRHLPLTPDHKELYNIIHRLCWRELRDFPNLVNCRDFNDRIQWLKLFDQDPEIIRCSDKVLVRDYVAERVGPQYLTKLYQVHERFDDIDFDSLPSAFVIKANHDSGTVILVRDKAQLDKGAAREQIDSALSRPYGWENGEWAYAFIKPRVMVEELLDPVGPKPPIDYKFFCANGKVKFCKYLYDRGLDIKARVVNSKFEFMDVILVENHKVGDKLLKPDNWEKMLELVELLSQSNKFVRVDLYNINHRIVFGEMTFFPMAGIYKGEGQKDVGNLIEFDRNTYKPPILSSL
jgi:hypothetical protein